MPQNCCLQTDILCSFARPFLCIQPIQTGSVADGYVGLNDGKGLDDTLTPVLNVGTSLCMCCAISFLLLVAGIRDPSHDHSHDPEQKLERVCTIR